MVEDASSEIDYAQEQKDYIRANHVDMCRFHGFDDDGYEKVSVRKYQGLLQAPAFLFSISFEFYLCIIIRQLLPIVDTSLSLSSRVMLTQKIQQAAISRCIEEIKHGKQTRR